MRQSDEKKHSLSGAGLGFRRSMKSELLEQDHPRPDFLEVAPENWIGIGGRLGRLFRQHSEQYAIAAHGLSLSIGGPAPIDVEFVKQVRSFIETHNIALYSEHLSYCADDGHLYDLMPIPFTEEAVKHVAARVRQVQDILGQRLILENVSFYAPLANELTELEFLNAVIEQSDCELLLDVNNVYVNSINHRYDPIAFIKGINPERVRYFHIAGHYVEAQDLIVDTHGANVIDPVWNLLELAYQHCGVKPTLLERDFNIPPLAELMEEVDRVRHYQSLAQSHTQQIQERSDAICTLA